MKIEPTITTIFCDDIRQEVANKITLVGCYTTELLVGRLPVTLPKLCAMTTLKAAAADLPGKFSVTAKLNGVLLGEPVSVPDGYFKEVSRIQNPESVMTSLNVVVDVSPLTLDSEGDLTVEVETDAGTSISGILRIRVAPQ